MGFVHSLMASLQQLSSRILHGFRWLSQPAITTSLNHLGSKSKDPTVSTAITPGSSLQSTMSTDISCNQWMQKFIGASELDLIQNKEKFIDAAGNLKHAETGQLWPMGIFEVPSVADLRREVEEMPEVRAPEQVCPLEVVDGTDIAALQASMKTEDKAMVQIASNFHCLENGNPSTSADCGHLVSGYCQDCTQGPAAAFGVPGASMLRAHYAFKAEGKPPEEWGQSSKRQVNLLEDICGDGNYCGKCQNGKALLLGSEIPVTPELLNDVAGKVKVGLHSDAQVVFGRGSKRGSLAVLDSVPFVDQVCSATLCYGFADQYHRPPPEDFALLTRALLRAAYEGAYLAAIKRGRHLLLLTLIGGASFRNPHEIIVEELKRAHEKYSRHPASQLVEVRLVLYENRAKHYQEAIRKAAAC